MQKGYRKFKRHIRRVPRFVRRLFHRKPAPDAVFTDYGIWVTPRPRDATFQLYVNGEYGKFFSRFLAQQRAPFVFLDVGSNQGLYAILAAKNPQCQAVFAFEPVPDTAAALEANLTLNRSEKVTVIRKGISDQPGTVQINFDEGHTGAASLRETGKKTATALEVEVIDAHGLDALVPDATVPIIVKVDVEGHEPVVLPQLLKATFGPRIRTIFYECDERWVDAERLITLLQAAGFTSFEKVGEGSHYDVFASRPQP